MGTKRVGLARTQALIENLKRDLDLNSSRFTDLVGAELIQYSAEKEFDAVAQGNFDVSLTIPANALITDIGYVCTAQIDVDSSGTLSFSAGLASSFTDAIASTQVNNTAADIIAGVVQSAMSTNIPHGSGTAIPTFLPGVVRFATSERTLNIRFIVGGADLAATGGKYRGWFKYIIVK